MPGPAATVGSMHVCPMLTPGTPPPPHVGGPVSGPGVPTVLIGGKPAAVMGDMCVCAGPPDTIVQGEATVLIGGKPAADRKSTRLNSSHVRISYAVFCLKKKKKTKKKKIHNINKTNNKKLNRRD